jgi:Protein of unknown function (DUF3987)
VNPLDRVAGWADLSEPSEPVCGPARAQGAVRNFEVEAFIQRHGLQVRRRGEWRGGEKWELQVCPINPEHTGGSAVITRDSAGALGFKCHHNSCSSIGWTDLRERLEPGYRKSDHRSVGGERLAPSGWPPIVPFAAVTVERIPEGLIPGPVGDMARSVAAATETPLEMAMMTGLGVVAASIAGKVQICPSVGYSEPLQLYVATVLPSGNRKTAVINAMSAPFRKAEAQLIEQLTPERKRLESVRKTGELTIDRLRKQAAAKSDSNALIEEIARREAELPELPAIPRFWTQDITPERLGTLMAENGGRMAVMSDEGGIFDILAGRYSKNAAPNLDLFLQGHSGSPVRVDRRSREVVLINTPALTLVVTPQPDVSRSLSEQKAFRGRGLLARFLFLLPPSTVGSRKHETIPIAAQTRDAYNRCISCLLSLPMASDGVPLSLRFSRESFARWKDFQMFVERQMAEDGRLYEILDWGSKLPGAVARLAGGIHGSLHAGRTIPGEIAREVTEIAITVGGMLISNALAAFRIMQKPEKIEHAEKVLAWIRRNGAPEFHLREMFRSHQTRFGEMAAMMPAVGLLQDHGYIRPREKEKKPGRPPDIFEVNPELLDGGQA